MGGKGSGAGGGPGGGLPGSSGAFRMVQSPGGLIPARAGTFVVPLSALERVDAQVWSPTRMLPIREAHDAGKASALPPVRVFFWSDGTMRVDDGNHRLSVARERNAKTIKVTFVRAPGSRRRRPKIPLEPGWQRRGGKLVGPGGHVV